MQKDKPAGVLCRDCKHYTSYRRLHMDDYHGCNALATNTQSKVSGEWEVLNRKECEDMREFDGPCKPAGKLFEPRVAIPSPRVDSSFWNFIPRIFGGSTDGRKR